MANEKEMIISIDGNIDKTIELINTISHLSHKTINTKASITLYKVD